MRSETAYQAELIKKLEDILPGCIILKNDPRRDQGIPDLLILFSNTWLMLEVKISESADHRPNQEYYVNMYNDMSYASFIWPEIEDEVLHDIQCSFGLTR